MRYEVREGRQLVVHADGEEVDRLSGVPGLGRMMRLMKQPKRQSDVCPACAWTRTKFVATGLLGCGLCYEVFGVVPLSSNV